MRKRYKEKINLKNRLAGLDEKWKAALILSRLKTKKMIECKTDTGDKSNTK